MNNSKIQQLVNETGCDEQLAKLLLIFTGGDIEASKKIINSIDKNIFIIKGKFACNNIRRSGIFLIFYNKKSGKIEKSEFFISNDKNILNININARWKEIVENIKQMKKNDSEVGDEVEINEHFKEEISKIEILDFFEKLVKNYEINRNLLIKVLSNIISNLTADINISVKVENEEIDIFEFGKGIKDLKEFDKIENEEENESGNKEKVAERSKIESEYQLITLECEPEYAPINGFSISNFLPGDSIKVKIIDDSDIGNYIAKLLHGIDENGNKVPLFATITEIEKLDEELLKITVEFGPGIYGKLIVGSDVKVEGEYQYNGEREKRKKGSKTSSKKEFKISTSFLLALIGTLIVIFIILLFLL